MTISGKFTGRYLLSRELAVAAMCLVTGVGGFSILRSAAERSNAWFVPRDRGTEMLVLGFFPAMAAISFVVILLG